MDDEEDVKKIMEILKSTEEDSTREFEYDEFINCDRNEFEENEIVNSDEDDYLLCDLSNTDISKLHTYDPRSSLKPEELYVIDNCSDPDLASLLTLNRRKNMQLIQLYKKMKDLLLECQKNIQDKGKIVKAYTEANKGLSNSTGAWRLAAPYFKDKQLYVCPPNADVSRKKTNNELSVYDLSPFLRWSSFECEKLIRAVKLNYNMNRQNALKKKSVEMSKSSALGENKEKLVNLGHDIEELNNTYEITEDPPLNSDEYIDWMRVSDVFLKDKHSAFECKSIWHIYLHPLINKSKWTPSENAKLKDLAKNLNYQNWDQIAHELGTNRTCFTACMHYYSNLHETFKKGEFTYEEDARLLDLVYQYRMGSYIPWVKIVHHFKDRTRAQLHYRYTYYLSQNDKKKGKFSEAEDILLMILVDRFGKNFKKCSQYLPTRSMVQCKSRYNTNLRNYLKKGSFTMDEDEIIMKYVEEHGVKAWTNLAETMQRARGQIRQRYYTIRHFLDGDPNLKLDAVPRRKHNLKVEEDTFHFLRIVADQYRGSSTIPTLEEIKRVVRSQKKDRRTCEDTEDESEDDPLSSAQPQQKDSSGSVPNLSVDGMLTDFFCNTFKMSSVKCISTTSMKKAMRDVATALTVLDARLDIPDNFDEDTRLDNLDVAILNRLLEDESGLFGGRPAKPKPTTLIPPNMNTVVGLRSLLIKFSHYRSEDHEEMMKFVQGAKKKHFVSGIRSDIINNLLRMPPRVREQVEDDRKLFYRRFYALFKWPAIMTLQGASLELQSICRSATIEESAPIQAKRTYSRRQTGSSCVKKRILVRELPKAPPRAVPLKLTPVTNKSVIEDLMRNKNKKLFCFDKVVCGEETKTVIREIPLSHVEKNGKPEAKTKKYSVVNIMESTATTSAQASGSRGGHDDCDECLLAHSDEEDAVSCSGSDESAADDEEDLKKLNVFLNEECSLQTEDEDLKDLKKLEMFLKKEKETDDTFIGESSFC